MAIDLVAKNIILKEWIIAQADCGEKIPDLIIYEQVSQYSILDRLITSNRWNFS